MIEVPIYNQSGDKIETFKLDPEKLGGEINRPLLKQALEFNGHSRVLARRGIG